MRSTFTWKTSFILLALALCACPTMAQNILFNFDSTPLNTLLPFINGSGGVTAQFSASGSGFSVKAANQPGLTPAGFSGRCLYPVSTTAAADLTVSFSQPVTSCSILYAVKETSTPATVSATMLVTAYLNGEVVGTATTNAQPGIWPSETLAITNAGGFDAVVVHYQADPVTDGNFARVFMVDNVVITVPPPPAIILQGGTMLPSGDYQFSFTNNPSGNFSVWAATNVSLPLGQWDYVGLPTETAPGQYQFTDYGAIDKPQRFYFVQRQ